jgi:FixJ family two-component response regulator
MKAGAVDYLPKPFDDENLLSAVKRALERSSEQWLQHSQRKEVRDRLATLTPRESEVLKCVIAGMSGLEVQKELQAVSPKTRVIISTANDHDSVRNAAIQAGAIAYFVKPFDDDAFLAAVHKGLACQN